MDIPVDSTADAYLEILARRGIRYFFANSGTDFAPLLESYAKRMAGNQPFPKPILCPHETTAVSMAHGFTMLTGEPQVVMVHVSVGTANAASQLVNVSRSRVPMLFSAGRTPLTEEGVRGGRSVYIHWAQESFDQAGMVREYVKWDYELRNFRQLEAVVDRALSLAMADPPGPVYLTLPREILAEPQSSLTLKRETARFGRGSPRPNAAELERAAELLAGAKRPLILAESSGVDPAAVHRLVELAETGAIPVVEVRQCYLNFPTNHPLHLGFEADELLREADVILVLESDVPWMPNLCKPSDAARVIHMGRDPYYSDYVIRSFPMDVVLIGDPAEGLRALRDCLSERMTGKEGEVQARRDEYARIHGRQRAEWAKQAEKVRGDRPIDMRWISRCINEVKDETVILVNEYDLAMTQVELTEPRTYFAASHAGSLGWGLGASLGAKLAEPDKTVIAAIGDGCYIFNVPTSAHFVARAQSLPFLTVIFNNQAWNAVKRATQGLYPDGWAAGRNQIPLSDLEPSPDFEKTMEAHGGYGERVEDPSEMLSALRRGLRAVREEGRQAVLNVICKHP